MPDPTRVELPPSGDLRALGSRIREARETFGWTQQQLADGVGVSRTTVVAIEKGERRLKPAELIQVAALLGRDVSDFLQRGAPAERFGDQLRGVLASAGTSAVELLQPIEELQHLCEEYVHLEALCKAPLRRRFPPEYEVLGSDPELAAEDIASSERRRLDLGEGPVATLREILEGDVGIRVFQLSLPSNVAGLFVCAEPIGACIAVNLHHPAERRRASLAREFGHFLTARHRPEITLEARFERRPAGERFAEAFARSFLMPASGLRRRFLELERERTRGVTYGDLCRLAQFYAVSVEVMTRRLEELRLIPAGTRDRLRMERFRGREAQQPLEPDAVHRDDEIFSPRYIALAVEAWQQGELSEGQLARALRTDRLGARETIQRLERSAADGSDLGEPIDFGAPLVRTAAR
jgi:Zn-dependent peptidase ImmA (M78 family)/DNA-binding XRE family transcriptional regulator